MRLLFFNYLLLSRLCSLITIAVKLAYHVMRRTEYFVVL